MGRNSVHFMLGVEQEKQVSHDDDDDDVMIMVVTVALLLLLLLYGVAKWSPVVGCGLGCAVVAQ